MLELIQITNDPAFARRCDALPGFRLWVDLERNGKAERQAGRNTFISEHSMDDVGRVRDAVARSPLMVRLNPLHAGSAEELDRVIGLGADLVMLPMFRQPSELEAFARLVDGRARLVALLETSEALESMHDWIETPGLHEIYVGLNDLHLSLGLAFMFEPLAMGMLDRVADATRSNGLRFGFGGIARLDEGLLPGRDVLAEHVRLGSDAVILSRSFHHRIGHDFEGQVSALRTLEAALTRRDESRREADRERIALAIRDIAAKMRQRV